MSNISWLGKLLEWFLISIHRAISQVDDGVFQMVRFKWKFSTLKNLDHYYKILFRLISLLWYYPRQLSTNRVVLSSPSFRILQQNKFINLYDSFFSFYCCLALFLWFCKCSWKKIMISQTLKCFFEFQKLLAFNFLVVFLLSAPRILVFFLRSSPVLLNFSTSSSFIDFRISLLLFSLKIYFKIFLMVLGL